MFTEQVGDAGNASRQPVDRLNGRRAEQFLSVAAGNAEAFEEITPGFLERKGQGFCTKGDSLAELAELRLVEFALQFGLPGQYDLEQLLGRSFKVGEETNFLQHLIREILCFVHDKNGAFPSLVAFEKPLVQFEENLTLHPRLARDTEIRHHKIEELGYAEPGI